MKTVRRSLILECKVSFPAVLCCWFWAWNSISHHRAKLLCSRLSLPLVRNPPVYPVALLVSALCLIRQSLTHRVKPCQSFFVKFITSFFQLNAVNSRKRVKKERNLGGKKSHWIKKVLNGLKLYKQFASNIHLYHETTKLDY